MGNQKTHILFLIDESGSMGGQIRSVVDGYNEFIGNLNKEELNQDVFCTLGFFDKHGNDPILRLKIDGENLSNIGELAYTDYVPRGTTPLNDAINESIAKLGNSVVKNDKIMMVIMTDGLENASELNSSDVKKLINEKEVEGWNFIYLGANQDAFTESSKLGLGNAGQHFNYSSTPAGTSSAIRMTTHLASAFMRGDSAGLKNLAQSLSDTIPENGITATIEPEIKITSSASTDIKDAIDKLKE